MLDVPRLWGIVTAFLSLLGTAADVARAVEVDPALLDACPGYDATNVKVDGPRLSANLVLAGKPCNVFGNDIKVLDLAVVYETGMSAAWYMATKNKDAASDGRLPLPTVQTRAFTSRSPTHPANATKSLSPSSRDPRRTRTCTQMQRKSNLHTR
jgi:hypothetical protein